MYLSINLANLSWGHSGHHLSWHRPRPRWPVWILSER